jgi:integrase
MTLELLARIETEDKVLVDLHFHDLRHEGTSRLADKLAMHELMKVTGHKSSRMLSRYYHPKASDLAAKLG